MSRKYFGTDGIRGRVGEYPITPDFMLKLGWAAGMAFRKQGNCRVLVGKDTKMPDYIVLISTLGGMALFGLTGFVIGPVVAALFIATWDLFAPPRPPVQTSTPK